MLTVCGSDMYPPSPCPTPPATHTGTGHPSASSTHGGTAFTGFDVLSAIVLVVVLLAAAALFRIRTRSRA